MLKNLTTRGEPLTQVERRALVAEIVESDYLRCVISDMDCPVDPLDQLCGKSSRRLPDLSLYEQQSGEGARESILCCSPLARPIMGNCEIAAADDLPDLPPSPA